MKKKYFILGNDEKNQLALKNEENNYDYDVSTYVYDENIKNDSHIAVVRQIKENSTVLDIGCASGILGATIVKYKNCIIDGIEYDKKACEVASSKNVYRDIYNFSISDANGVDYQKFINLKRKYDYIVFADVLEHLVNPWDAIVNVSKMLNKDGAIIISLPNIAHLDIIRALINNEFNYTKWGILDKTHLRFFTPSSFKDMIDNIASNYKVYFNIELIEDILIKPEYFTEFEEYSLFNMNSNLESYLALQHVYKLTLSKNLKSMKNNIQNINTNNFDKMLKSHNDLIEKNKKDAKEIIRLSEENDRINSELKIYQDKYNSIINSKRYKLINKISNFFKK